MYKQIKPVLDKIFALLIILGIWWVLALISLLIVLEDGKGVFFRQKRVGKNNTHFYIYKFRTMKKSTPKDVPTHLLEDPDKYITKTGAFLRKTSLDELPQLFNIIKGEMSFVGPRPALWNQYDLIRLRDQNRSSLLTPGLTGLAQVNGRDELPIEVKAEYDGMYYKKLSFITDIKIILKTAVNVFTSEGVREGKR